MEQMGVAPDQKLDAAILAASGPQFLKVARVIADVAGTFGASDELFLHRVAGRIAVLVAANRLEAAGDISRWRHSEIRLKL